MKEDVFIGEPFLGLFLGEPLGSSSLLGIVGSNLSLVGDKIRPSISEGINEWKFHSKIYEFSENVFKLMLKNVCTIFLNRKLKTLGANRQQYPTKC